MGYRCPVKKQCSRYTDGLSGIRDGGYMVHCTNQRMFKQDAGKVNESCLKDVSV